MLGVRWWRLAYPAVPGFTLFEYAGTDVKGVHEFLAVGSGYKMYLSTDALAASYGMRPFLYDMEKLRELGYAD